MEAMGIQGDPDANYEREGRKSIVVVLLHYEIYFTQWAQEMNLLLWEQNLKKSKQIL